MSPFERLVFIFALVCLYASVALSQSPKQSVEEEVYGVKYASDCEVCKLLTGELLDRLQNTGKSHDVIETGYTFDGEKRSKKKYAISELRLIESIDKICDTLLDYNVHKERTDSSRFAKGMSSTFKTLHGLVDKGVKVDLGIPYDLWDKPPAEVTYLKTQCEKMIEEHESDIEDWYFHHQEDASLSKYLCEDRVLSKGDGGCLQEKPDVQEISDENAKHKSTKTEL